MRADVTHGAYAARAGRVRAPSGLFLALTLEEGRKPALGVFDVNLSDRSKLTGSHASTRLLHHGVARIGMGQAEMDSLLSSALNGVFQCIGLFQGYAQRLVEDDVKARV